MEQVPYLQRIYLQPGHQEVSSYFITLRSLIYYCYLHSVAALSSPRYKVGDTISMKLMVREKVLLVTYLTCCISYYISSLCVGYHSGIFQS